MEEGLGNRHLPHVISSMSPAEVSHGDSPTPPSFVPAIVSSSSFPGFRQDSTEGAKLFYRLFFVFRWDTLADSKEVRQTTASKLT